MLSLPALRLPASVLSVGSGDGSQQVATLRAGHINLVTTFYDSKAEVLRKYPRVLSEG
jgi:hypothetical protein